MLKLIPLILLILLGGCYSVRTNNDYNKDFTFAHSQSEPIYLSFKDTKNAPYYFILSRDSNQKDYKLRVRWCSNKKNDLLFNGYESTIKFLIDRQKIMRFKPIRRPKLIALDLNNNGHEEEATFSLSIDEFFTLAYAKSVDVELTGRYHTVTAYFNQRNTLKAFQNFAENSH